MTSPRRIQLSRRKGWRKPPGAVNVARPSSWGNPYRIGVDCPDAECAVRAYWQRLQELDLVVLYGDGADHHMAVDERITALAGRDLACWCKLDQPCHADVLLALANGTPLPRYLCEEAT